MQIKRVRYFLTTVFTPLFSVAFFKLDSTTITITQQLPHAVLIYLHVPLTVYVPAASRDLVSEKPKTKKENYNNSKREKTKTNKQTNKNKQTRKLRERREIINQWDYTTAGAHGFLATDIFLILVKTALLKLTVTILAFTSFLRNVLWTRRTSAWEAMLLQKIL